MGPAELYISGPSWQTQAAPFGETRGKRDVLSIDAAHFALWDKKKFKTWTVVLACLFFAFYCGDIIKSR